MLNLSIAIIASILVISLLARYLPRTILYRRFALLAANPPGPSFATVPRQFATALPVAPGAKGMAVTTLRPSGKGKFGDRVLDVVTAGDFISAETPIVVSEIDGMRVVVTRASAQSAIS